MTALITGGGGWGLGIGKLLAVRNPDVFYFRRAAEELASLTLTRIEPVARARRAIIFIGTCFIG